MSSTIRSEKIISAGANVEVLWAKPDGEGPWPLFLFVHGHMEGFAGAQIHKNFLRSQVRLNRWNVCLASVSQPGYGNSDGPADYCGPRTQKAILDTIHFFRNKPIIDSHRIALIGYSRGAICAANVAAADPSLAAIVLGSGFYDFESYYRVASSRIRKAIENEAGVNAQAFKDRSAIFKTDLIRSPMLILHGRLDERGGSTEAEQFSKLSPNSRLKIYQNLGHHIPFRTFYREVRNFLEPIFREDL